MSDYYDLVKRAFIETLAHVGIPIVFRGATKQCVTGSIEKKRFADVSGYLPQAASQVDMLDDDFKQFSNLGFGDRSTVLIDGVNLRVIVIDSEPSDPVVRMVVTGDK